MKGKSSPVKPATERAAQAASSSLVALVKCPPELSAETCGEYASPGAPVTALGYQGRYPIKRGLTLQAGWNHGSNRYRLCMCRGGFFIYKFS
jgi:hypothetical protein